MWPTEANNGAGHGAGHGRSRFVMCVCAWAGYTPLLTLLRPGDQCKLKLSAVALGKVALARSLAVSLALASVEPAKAGSE